MNIHILQRTSMTDKGTFGVLHNAQKYPLCVTLEDPEKSNQRNISCIPAGVYQVVSHSGEHFKNVWRLLDVKDRDGILIHAGNTIDDTQGCILVGCEFGSFQQSPAILESKRAMALLKRLLPEKFTLIIKNP